MRSSAIFDAQNMELPPSVARGLAACGELPPAAFRAVVDAAANSAELSTPEQQLAEAGLAASLGPDAAPLGVKQAFAAAVSVVVEAAVHDAGAAEVVQALDDAGLDGERAKLLAKRAAAAKPGVRAALARTAFDFARVVGVDWRMDYLVRSSALDRVRVPVYFVTLRTLEPGGEPRDVQFTCSLQELQDLTGKLRDCLKQVERITGAQ